MMLFPIPSLLQDLEKEPYNLQPYPAGFEDDDEATRANSFDQLVEFIERGNRSLANGGLALFEVPEGEEDEFEQWNDEERVQALYTLVRKSSSLASGTRKRLVGAICKACCSLASALQSAKDLVPESFRSALACHLYMLYNIMSIYESESKASNASKATKSAVEEMQNSREACAVAMNTVTHIMAKYKSTLWKRGVADESIVTLPCRIAYQMMENATGVQARKLASGDLAIQMIASTLNSTDCLLNTVVSALVDMLHSYEHMAPLVAEICALVNDEPKNKLAFELLKEIGSLDGNAESDTSGKASGIKNVAPFLNCLAEKKPQFMLEHIDFVLPHLQAEPYNLRSAILTSIGHILIQCNLAEKEKEEDREGTEEEEEILENDNKAKKLSKTKEQLYQLLLEHVYDVSSYTRVAVLKTWATLIEARVLPVDKLAPITKIVIDRLQDKTVMVRRIAMQILTMVLENNPFTDSLSPRPYEEKLAEVRLSILEKMPSHLKEAMKAALEEVESDQEDGERVEIEIAAINATVADVENSQNDLEDSIDKELVKKVKAYKFLQSALEFIQLFEGSNDSFQSMLLSSNKSDVTEALRFFVRARHFQLPCAVTGIKQALSLMWSNEKSVQDEVLTAFTEVFICGPDTKVLPSAQIVDNLIKLIGKSSVSEIACIEEALSRLVSEEKIPSEVFLILWSIAAKAHGKPRSVAMMILSMGATSDPSIVDSASRLRHLLVAGLGDYTEENRDWATAKSAAYALQRVSRVKCDPSSAKFLVLEQIVERLCKVAQGDWCDDTNENDTKEWFGAAEEAVNAIFSICPAPDLVSRIIISSMSHSTFGSGEQLSCHSLRLSRFFFVIGHIAMKLLVYTESISGSVRNANAARTLAKQEEADKAKADSSEENDDIEAELGLAQAAEVETENKVAEIAEKEIICRGLIGLFTPILVRVVANEDGLYSSTLLMQTSTLALCKFMCISKSFCEKHLPLLFTALANAPTRDVTLRANTVIAMGDLAFRFPNEVEPYTPRIYACLRDESTRVRLHTLMVLTHLILNDMVKCKNQVAEVALCLRDDELRIRDMARLLFHELSKRSNNPIYNLLPDIVSRLSTMSVKKEDFRGVMSFLLGFIKKERQIEMLVEKLCLRFPKCTSISQKADISYCLSLLKMNEKCIKIMSDSFKLYKDALFDEDVMKNFSSIVIKAKKFAKPEMKEFVEDWETKLNELSQVGLENELAGKKALKAKSKAAKRKAKKPQKKVEDDYSVHSDDDEDDSPKDLDDEYEFDDKENMANIGGKSRKNVTYENSEIDVPTVEVQ